MLRSIAMKLRISGCLAAITAWAWTLAAHAQTVPIGSDTEPMFGESMDRGLVPLFFFVAAGIGVMTLAALLVTMVIRPRLPRSLRGA